MLSKLSPFSIYALLSASALTLLPFGLWWQDPLTSFHPQLLLCSLILAVLFRRRKRATVALLLAATAHAVFLAPSLIGHARAESTPHDLRLLVSNVLTSNTEHAKLIALVHEIEPDVMILVEVSEAWVDGIQELKSVFPYRITHPRSDNFGLVMWSRFPLDGSVEFLDSHLPSIVATVHAAEPFLLIATHPIPPISRHATENRDLQLHAIARLAAASKLPVVVAGDFNSAGWSPSLLKIQAAGGLRNASRGWVPTWPVYLFPLWVPLDHVLYSDGIGITDFHRAPSIGSDHYPIYADLRVLSMNTP